MRVLVPAVCVLAVLRAHVAARGVPRRVLLDRARALASVAGRQQRLQRRALVAGQQRLLGELFVKGGGGRGEEEMRRQSVSGQPGTDVQMQPQRKASSRQRHAAAQAGQPPSPHTHREQQPLELGGQARRAVGAGAAAEEVLQQVGPAGGESKKKREHKQAQSAWVGGQHAGNTRSAGACKGSAAGAADSLPGRPLLGADAAPLNRQVGETLLHEQQAGGPGDDELGGLPVLGAQRPPELRGRREVGVCGGRDSRRQRETAGAAGAWR